MAIDTENIFAVSGKAPTEPEQRQTWWDQSRAIRCRIKTFKLEGL